MINRLSKIFLVFIFTAIITGCATHFGREILSAKVKFLSEPSELGFYLITRSQNKALSDGHSPIANQQLPASIISEGKLYTNGPRYVLKIGEHVVLWPCKGLWHRRHFYFEGVQSERLDCR